MYVLAYSLAFSQDGRRKNVDSFFLSFLKVIESYFYVSGTPKTVGGQR